MPADYPRGGGMYGIGSPIPRPVGMINPTALPISTTAGAPGAPAPAARMSVPPISTVNGVPDPNSASNAQTTSNQQNSQYNNALTHGSTTTPLGSQTYTSHIDPRTGAVVYDTNVSINPDQQLLLNQQNRNALTLGGTETKLAGDVAHSYGSSVPGMSYSWDDLTKARQDVQDALYKRNTAMLDPQYAQRQSALETQLSNQGILTGSDAWRTAMDNFARERGNDYASARNDSISGGLNEMLGYQGAAGTEWNQKMAIRNEPLAEWNALHGANQVNIPQFNPAQTPLSANTDVAGNAYRSSDEMLRQQEIRQAGSNATKAGLFGLGASILGAPSNSVVGGLVNTGLSKLGGMFGIGAAAGDSPALAATASGLTYSPAEIATMGGGISGGGGAGVAGAAGAAGGDAGAVAGAAGEAGAPTGMGGGAGGAWQSYLAGQGGDAAGAGAGAATGSLAGGLIGSLPAAAIVVKALTSAPYQVKAEWWQKLGTQLDQGTSGNATYDANTPPDQQKYNAKVSLFRLLQSQGQDKAIIGGANGNVIPQAYLDKAKSYGMIDANGNINTNWNPGEDPFVLAQRKMTGYVMYNGHWVPARGVGGGGGGRAF